MPIGCVLGNASQGMPCFGPCSTCAMGPLIGRTCSTRCTAWPLRSSPECKNQLPCWLLATATEALHQLTSSLPCYCVAKHSTSLSKVPFPSTMAAANALVKVMIIMSLVLTATALVVMVTGLAGLQSVCRDWHDSVLSDLQARIAPLQQQSRDSSQQDSLVISVVNSTNHMFGSFARNLAQSSSFATCARMYSLHW